MQGWWLAALAGLAVGPVIASATLWLPDCVRRAPGWWRGAGAGHRRILMITIVSAVVLGLLAWRLGPSCVTPAYVGAGVAGVAFAVTDWERFILPDVIMWPLYGWTLLWMLVDTVTTGQAATLIRAVVAGMALGLGGLVLAFGFPGGFGLGDCKLLGVLGALLGWIGWSAAWLGLALGLLIGAVWSLSLVATRRRTRGSPFPLGPSLLAGAFLAVVISRV